MVIKKNKRSKLNNEKSSVSLLGAVHVQNLLRKSLGDDMSSTPSQEGGPYQRPGTTTTKAWPRRNQDTDQAREPLQVATPRLANTTFSIYQERLIQYLLFLKRPKNGNTTAFKNVPTPTQQRSLSIYNLTDHKY